jgi:hypothetical protein
MLTRALVVTSVLLAAIVIYQYDRIGQLEADVVTAQAQAVTRARAVTAESMQGQADEVQRTLTWLNNFYKSQDGLQRPEGLWINDGPDFVGISAWVFDVYLRGRLMGLSEDEARKAVETAIKQSDEWKTKHAPPS